MSLANNKLKTADSLQLLAHYLPNLENLSLENNKLCSWRDMDSVAGKKGKDRLTQLREILVMGNPLREDMIRKKRLDIYKM